MAVCRRIVAWVVADGAGIEWFVCGVHSQPAVGARWTSKTALAEWLRARGRPAFDPALQCPTIGDAIDDDDVTEEG